jgi:hypothetical protein
VSVLLPAPDPEAWLAMHLAAHLDARGGPLDPGDSAGPTRWFTLDQLLAHDGAIPREIHTRLMADEGLPARGAATYLAGWIGGALADAIGFALATAGAGFLVNASTVRWHQHPSGWMDRVDLGNAGIVVATGHPWSGQPGVDTVGDPQIVRELTVLALVAVVTPIIDFCHSLTRVGRGGLWNEVGDSLGMAVAFQPSIPVEREVIDSLAAAVRASGAPWKSRPTVRIAEGVTGPVYVAQKGGCCLAYTRPKPPALNVAELDEPYRDYLARFPEQGRGYCSTCSLRDFADCEARQLFWLECMQQVAAAESPTT